MDQWWWKEYPERDTEYVRWYPPDISPLSSQNFWADLDVYTPSNLGFYIHVPFCEEICQFCPYNKFLARDDEIERYLKCLVIELEKYSRFVKPQSVPFIYFGGGTPSVLSGSQIETVLSNLSHLFPVGADTEITLETNPITSSQRIEDFYKAGVNRLSFGIQSFQDNVLKTIGSHHNALDGYRVIDAARDSGFENLGIDLMFRLPGQSIDDWMNELNKAIELGLVHVSCYSMILDPLSSLAKSIERGTVQPQADDKADLEMSRSTLKYMMDKGYMHYASCASCGHDFAIPGWESRYEKLHWGAPQVDYLGIGPGAYGFVNKRIYCNQHTLRSYADSVRSGLIPVVAGKHLTFADQMSRFMVLGLKCIEVSKNKFAESFGIDVLDVFGDQITQLVDWGLIEVNEEKIRVTDHGRLYIDNISKAFYNKDNYMVSQPLEPELQLLSAQGIWKR